MSFFAQPYLPFNESDEDPPADVFNRPVLRNGGPHLVYLDVWQREVTHLQDPDLVEKAVGVDTTARTQTVWQVRVLQNVGNATCATDDEDVPGWSAIVQPSGARLTTSTGDLPGDPNPCLVPPAAGYKGLENQLYRVEIHHGGPQGTATFKWSRDNATVATRVTEIHAGTRLVVESLGRDDVLGFHPGDWIEILDDWHELHGLPGLLRRIRPGDGVVAATRSILFDDALPAGLFPVDGQGLTDATRHTRIRRWDQSNQVRRADGSVFHDLNASASSDGIPVPPAGTVLALEDGILVEFGLAGGGEFRVGDHWEIAARVADGSIDILDEAPPRGIHHHYARLAVVTLPGTQEDCRIHWPPAGGGESCDCTVCVHAEAHNAGTATIQQAIDAVRTRGGTVCLDAGTYVVNAPLNLDGARSVRIRGQGWRTLLQAGKAGALVNVSRATGVAIENLAMVGAAVGEGTATLIGATHCIDLQLSHLVVVAVGPGDATAAAVGLSGIALGCSIRDCTLVAEQGVIARHGEPNYLLTANLRITDSLLFCGQQGIRLDGATLHYGEVRIAGNLLLACSQAAVTVTGASFPNAAVTIDGNVLQVSGTGIRAGVDGLRILDNELVGAAAQVPPDGIAFAPGLDAGAIDRAMVTGNRIRGIRRERHRDPAHPRRHDDQVERDRGGGAGGDRHGGRCERELSLHREQPFQRDRGGVQPGRPPVLRRAPARRGARRRARQRVRQRGAECDADDAPRGARRPGVGGGARRRQPDVRDRPGAVRRADDRHRGGRDLPPIRRRRQRGRPRRRERRDPGSRRVAGDRRRRRDASSRRRRWRRHRHARRDRRAGRRVGALPQRVPDRPAPGAPGHGRRARQPAPQPDDGRLHDRDRRRRRVPHEPERRGSERRDGHGRRGAGGPGTVPPRERDR